MFEVLPKRFGKYGLTLHPEKTQLVDFRRPRRLGKRASGPKLRHARLHPLLGQVPKGAMGGETGKRPKGRFSRAVTRIGQMVPDQPALVRGGTTDGPQPEATRSLQLLWSDW